MCGVVVVVAIGSVCEIHLEIDDINLIKFTIGANSYTAKCAFNHSGNVLSLLFVSFDCQIF